MASFTDAQSGNWNDTNTWNESGTPGTGDDVTISTYTVTLTQNETCGSCDIQGGNLTITGYKLTVDNGSFTVADSSGLLTTGSTGEIDLTGTGNLSNPNSGNIIYKLNCCASGNTTTVTGYSKCRLCVFGSGTLSFSGFNAIEIGQGSQTGDKILTVATEPSLSGSGEVYFTCASSGLVTWDGFDAGAIGTSWFGGGTGGYRQVTRRFITTGGGWLWNNGDMDCNDFNFNCNGLTINNCEFKGGNGTHDVESVDSSTNNATMTLESCTLKISGDFDMGASSTINEGTSTVEADGSGTQSVTLNGESLNNFKTSNTSGKVQFDDASDLSGDLSTNGGTSTYNVEYLNGANHHWGGLDTSGLSGAGFLDLDSMSAGNQWNLTIDSNDSGSHVNVKDSNLTGNTITVNDGTSVDGGNNSANWIFTSTGANGSLINGGNVKNGLINGRLI